MTRRTSLICLCLLLSICLSLLSCAAPIEQSTRTAQKERTAASADGYTVGEWSMPALDTHTPAHPSCVATYELSAEEQEHRYGIPDSLATGATEELLRALLTSPFMEQQLFAPLSFSSMDMYDASVDYTVHEAYAELIGRDDLAPVLMRYAAQLSPASISNPREVQAFDLLMKQPAIRVALGHLDKDTVAAPIYLSTLSTDHVLSYVLRDIVTPAYLGSVCFSTAAQAEAYLDRLSFASFEAYDILLSRDDLGEALTRAAAVLYTEDASAHDKAALRLLLDKLTEDMLR